MGGGKLAQQVKEPAAKRAHLREIPRTDTVEETVSCKLSFNFYVHTVAHMCLPRRTINKNM